MLQCSIRLQHDKQGVAMPVQKIHREPDILPDRKEKAELGDTMAKLFTTGVSRIAEIQKRAIDTAVQQHTELTDAWKKLYEKVPGAPGVFLLDLDRDCFERIAETQKAAIDLVAEHSKSFADLLKERTTTTCKNGDTVVEFAQQGVERAVATQKKALENAAAQTKAVFDAAKRQFGYEGGPVEVAADSIQRGVNAIVDAQKELLDMAVR